MASTIKVTVKMLASKARALVAGVQKDTERELEFVVLQAQGLVQELFESAKDALLQSGIPDTPGGKPSFSQLVRFVNECKKYLDSGLYTVQELLQMRVARNFQTAASAIKYVADEDSDFDKAGLTKLLKHSNLQVGDVRKATGQVAPTSGSGSGEGEGESEGTQNATVLLTNANTILANAESVSINERKAIVANIRRLIAQLDVSELRTVYAFTGKAIAGLTPAVPAEPKAKVSARPKKAKAKKAKRQVRKTA